MLSPSELASMRATLEGSLPETCDVLRSTWTPDGRGGRTRDETAAYEGVACRRSPVGFTDEERVVAARITDATAWTFTLPAGTRVLAGDVIDVDGNRFEVVSTLSERSWELAARIVCKEVE